jgi:glycosyltransferase involved in cell wall biosynthesis
MRELGRRGVENLLIARRGPLLERAAAEGIPAAAWQPRGDWDLLTSWGVARRLRSWKADVVHCHDARSHAVGVPAARRAGARAIVVSRRVAFPIGGNPLSALKYRMPVDRYVCVSRCAASQLRAAGVPKSRLALVHDAFEPEASSPTFDLRGLLHMSPDAPLVGTVAALTPEKGHAHLLEAAAIVTRAMPEAHFVWLGEGECRESLLARRARLGLDSRVHVLGYRADAQALLGQCTVCASASTSEGLGSSLIEALAIGVPVVATAVGGVPEVIEDGRTGRLVPPGDPAAMAAALLEALSRPELRQSWRDAGRLFARAFRAEHMAERTLAEYRAALESRSRPADL